MKICSGYSQWSLRRQLQTIFITSYAILISLYIVMTVLQLKWLEDYLDRNSYKVIKDNMIDQLKLISEAELIHSRVAIQNIYDKVLMRALMAEATLGFSSVSENYFDKATPIKTKEVGLDAFNYSYAYHSRFAEISSEGYEIVSKMAGLNPILEQLFDDSCLAMYEGFYADEIINITPLKYLDDPSYSPLNREWFYKAVNNPNEVISTEPYLDLVTGELIATLSKAILNSTNVIGVSAIDISTARFTKKISKIKVTNSGRVLVVSSTGILLTPISEWGNQTNFYRVYNESLTGISYSKWEEIKKKPSGSNFELYIKGFGDCFATIEDISSTNDLYFYLFAVIRKSEIDSPIKKLKDSFQTIYNYLFWSVIIISAIFLVVSIVLIYYFSRSTTIKFRLVNKIFEKVKNRACFQFVTQNCSFKEIENNDSGVKTFVENCKEKINSLTEKEKKFNYFKWNQTRPSNTMLHSRWKRKIYPFNRFSEKSQDWNQVIDEIGKIVG